MTSSQELQLVISRISRALSSRKQPGYRDIRLGLNRINRVIPDLQEWKGVHVAGTNGKGSICAFLAGLFKLAGVGYGSFTSPAFPERHNGVVINGLFVNKRMYEMEREHVQAKWDRISAGWTFQHGEAADILSPFELETATAFRVFNKMHVPYGIVEVGMGGATDATNAMKSKAITVISKIGLDHQEYLGNNIEKIAKVKAGIMQKNVPCIVDHTNPPSVIRVLRAHAREVGTEIILTWKGEPLLLTLDNEKWKLEAYQIQNLLCASMAFRHMFPLKEINFDKLLEMDPFPPGRMEQVEIDSTVTGSEPRSILVDGAHNMLGIEGLVSHVNKRLRKDGQPVTWVMGMSSSKHKPFDKILKTVVQPHDNFAFVEFTQQPNDPQPAPANFGTDIAKSIITNPDQVYSGEPSINHALPWACAKAGDEGPVVVTGSLYLVRDLFNLEGVERKRVLGSRRPGRAQLHRYVKLAQDRPLTEEEHRDFKQARRHWHLSPVRNPTFVNVHKGGAVQSPQVSAETSELQRKAAYHGKQRDTYTESIAAIREDLERARASEQTSEITERIEKLASQLVDLQKQAATHREEYQEAMKNIRGRVAVPSKKYLGHRSIFGEKRKPKQKTTSPFAAASTQPEEEVTPSIKWDDPSTDETERVSRQKQNALRRKLAADRNAEKSADPFAAKLQSGRRAS